MRFALVLLLLFSSGCATLKARERQDPGYGAYTGVLHFIGVGVGTAACFSQRIVQEAFVMVVQREMDQKTTNEIVAEEELQEKYRLAYAKARLAREGR